MSADPGRRILVDGYWWASGPPSGRNVLRSLIAAWSEHYASDRLTLVVRRDEHAAIQDDLGRSGIDADLQSYTRAARVQAIAALSIGRHSPGHDAVLTQNFATRSPGAVSCVLVHDAIYVEHPEWFSPLERVYLSALRPALRRADLIFTTSQSETARVARVWPETRQRLRPIGLGVPVRLSGAAARRPESLDGDRPYILVVGRLNVRKNLGRLLAAFRQSPTLPASYRLVVVGERDGKADGAASASASASRVSFLERVGDAELRWLYEHCSLFVFPSLDEGFGLPLIEARAFGARAVASDIPSFRELGIAEAYFDPTSVDAIEHAMSAALDGGPAAPGPGSDPAPDGWAAVVGRIRDAIDTSLSKRSVDVAAS
jgi:glycosyltransferase involved in cell wall biosynthesis